MESYESLMNGQYGRPDLDEQILDALRRAGHTIDGLTREDIASFDEFHIRGREATRELARLAALEAGMRVLDLGSGIGGPARTLAAEFDVAVVGVDMIAPYCRTAAMLTERVGLDDHVSFQQADIRALPFAPAAFDAVFSQHVLMNIEDKAALFKQIHRLLRPGGRYVLYEICAGPGGPAYYPVPWADEPAISFLERPDTLQTLLEETGFEQMVWEDLSDLSLEAFDRVIAELAERPQGSPPPFGLRLVMGETAHQKVGNLRRGLAEDRLRVVRGVFARPA